jgi:hypothetical protein
MILIPAIVVGGHLVFTVADRPPVVNFEQTCRASSGELQTNDKFEICVADEKQARDQLTRQWSSFDPGARTRCARTATSGHAASYIELLVCLELDQADREVRGHGSSTGIIVTEPERPVGEREEATATAPSRPGPVVYPNPAGPVAPPTRPAPIKRAQQQPVATVAPPAAPAPAAPLPAAPQPLSPPPPTSQGEVLQQSICRSPLGYVFPGCQ